MNEVQVVGRLVRDPDLRYTESGKALCFITIAADRRYRNKSGEIEADFIPVKMWGNMAEVVAEHLTQGRRVAVSGSLRTRIVNKREVTYNEVQLNADYFEFLDYPSRKPLQAEDDEPNESSVEEPAKQENAPPSQTEPTI